MTDQPTKLPPRRISITRDAAAMIAGLLMDFHSGLYHGKRTQMLQNTAKQSAGYLFGMLSDAPDTTNWLEEMHMLLPWVDHETVGPDEETCSDRCPKCRVQQLIVREEERCRLDSIHTPSGLRSS